MIKIRQYRLNRKVYNTLLIILKIMSNIIYKLTNKKTGAIYIGATNDLKRRMQEHSSRGKALKNREKNIKLYQDINKYGIELFKVDILESNIDDENKYKREQYYIKKYNALSEDNYNSYQSLNLLQDINNDEIITAFRNGESASQIGKKYGVKHPQITELLKKNMDIEEYNRLMKKHACPRKNIPIEEIVRLIEEEGYTKKEASEILGVCDSTVVRRYNNWKKKQDPNFKINPYGLGQKKVDIKLIVDTYLQTKNVEKTKKITKYAESTVRKYLKKEGIL